MASRDEDFGADLALTEGNDAIWSPSGPAPGREARDWRSLYEQAHARAERECSRADAAEARAEELRWAEVDARGRAGSLKWQLDRCRNKLKAAVEETKDVRRTAKNAPSLQAEVTRLEKLLSEASIEPAKGRPIAQADTERRRLRATLERAENRKATIESLRAERGELRKEVTRDGPGQRSLLREKPGKLDLHGLFPGLGAVQGKAQPEDLVRQRPNPVRLFAQPSQRRAQLNVLVVLSAYGLLVPLRRLLLTGQPLTQTGDLPV